MEYSSKYELKHDGYCIKHDENSDETECIRIQGISQNGILYGVFGLLRLIDCNSYDKDELIIENPKKDLRIINQWDNIDGTIERGYAGSSILYEGKRNEVNTKTLDLELLGSLHFRKLNLKRYPCLEYALESIKTGGTMPCALNACNEEAVYAFLEGKISFLEIEEIIRCILDTHRVIDEPTIQDIVYVDQLTRKLTIEEIKRRQRL